MAWYTLPLIMGAGKLTAQLLNKPRSYRPDLSWLNKLINERKSDIGKKSTYNLMMQGASEQAGTAAARARSENKYNAYNQGLEGSGMVASSELDILKSSNAFLKGASNQAMIQQRGEDSRLRSNIDEMTMMKEQIKSQYRQQNQMAEDQWKSGLINTGVDTALNLATAGINNAAAWKEAEELAQASGWTGDLRTLGSDPTTALKALGMQTGNQQTKKYIDTLMNLKDIGVEDLKTMWQNKNISEKQFESLFSEKLKLLEGDKPSFQYTTSEGQVVSGRASGLEAVKKLEGEPLDFARLTAQEGLDFEKVVFPGQEEPKSEKDWYLGSDGLEHEQVRNSTTGQWQDTGITRKANYQDRDTQEKAKDTLTNIISTLEIYDAQAGGGMLGKELAYKLANKEYSTDKEVKNAIRDYVFNLEIPINNLDIYAIWAGATPEEMKGTNEAKLFTVRMALYEKLTKMFDAVPEEMYLKGTDLRSQAGGYNW